MNVFVLFHLFYDDNIYLLNVIFPKTFTFGFFGSNFVNTKIGLIFVEYNNVSLIGANCKKLHKNIILILPNGKMLDLKFM